MFGIGKKEAVSSAAAAEQIEKLQQVVNTYGRMVAVLVQRAGGEVVLLKKDLEAFSGSMGIVFGTKVATGEDVIILTTEQEEGADKAEGAFAAHVFGTEARA